MDLNVLPHHSCDDDEHICLLQSIEPRKNPMQSRHAHIHDSHDVVAHDLGSDGGFLGHRQITRAGADDSDVSRVLGQRFLLDGHAAGEFVVDGVLEFFPQRFRVFESNPRDEDILFTLDEFTRDRHDLFRSFACAKDDFGETLSQRAMRVHLRESKVCHGRGLKRAQHLIPLGFSGAKLFQ